MTFFPLIAPTVTAASGCTVLRARQIIGEELGWWHLHRVTTQASGPDGLRAIIVDELEDDEEARERLDGAYCYVRSGSQAGAQRRLVTGAYDGPRGAMMVSRSFDGALDVGDYVEISYPLPVKANLDRKGLNDMTEEGCDRTVVDARIQLTGNGTTEITLIDTPWLHAYEQTRGIYDRRPAISSSEPMVLSPYSYNLRGDGADVSLITSLTYGSDEAIELAVVAPGNRLLSDGSAWAYFPPKTITDTATDDWQLAVPEHWIRAFGMVKALQHLAHLARTGKGLTDAERANFRAEAAERMPTYARAAARIVQNEFSPQIQEVTTGLATTATVHSNAWPSTRSSWGSGWPS